MLTDDDLSEASIQKAVFSHLRQRAMPGAVFWHVPNDKSSRRKAGYLEGVSDVSIVHRGEFFALELKTKKGAPSCTQMDFLKAVNTAGGFAYIAYGLDDALSWLEAQGITRRAA